MSRVITLLTDFGTADHYAASIKGRILRSIRDILLIDISHDVPPQDVAAAAYLLAGCWRDFPEGTIHLCVVDPGVGGDRMEIAVRADGQYFVGPDNGIFTHVIQGASGWEARQIISEGLFDQPVSNTFHGRDIFAPVAAELASGFSFEDLGPVIIAPYELDVRPVALVGDELRGAVIHIDRFGNIISNITRGNLDKAGLQADEIAMELAGEIVDQFFDNYDAAGDEPFMIFGSGGHLECALRLGSAAEALGIRRGDQVIVRNIE